MMQKKRVLILCTGNSARSQMAEGLLRHDAGDRFEVESAGTRPGQVRPEAIAVMNEIGIDLSAHRSKHVDEFTNQAFDYVLTVCDNAKRKLSDRSRTRRPNPQSVRRPSGPRGRGTRAFRRSSAAYAMRSELIFKAFPPAPESVNTASTPLTSCPDRTAAVEIVFGDDELEDIALLILGTHTRRSQRLG